jgi:hypothetical protein
MRQLVVDLLERYEAEVRPNGLLYLELRMRGHGALIIEETIKHRQLRVCYWLFDGEGNPVPEPEVLFHIDPGGRWIPYAIHRHTAGHHAYADLDLARNELLVTDPKHQAALAVFADSWADILRAQGWATDADKCITQPRVWPEDEDETTQPPDEETLWNWVDEYGLCTATDGCWVTIDGMCEHGHSSWLVALGLV